MFAQISPCLRENLLICKISQFKQIPSEICTCLSQKCMMVGY